MQTCFGHFDLTPPPPLFQHSLPRPSAPIFYDADHYREVNDSHSQYSLDGLLHGLGRCVIDLHLQQLNNLRIVLGCVSLLHILSALKASISPRSSLPSMPPLILLPNTRFSKSEDYDDQDPKSISLSSSSLSSSQVFDS